MRGGVINDNLLLASVSSLPTSAEALLRLCLCFDRSRVQGEDELKSSRSWDLKSSAGPPSRRNQDGEIAACFSDCLHVGMGARGPNC